MCGDGENTLHDLRVAASAYEGVQVHLSKWSPVLAESAERNSRMCATKFRGGHHLWDKRFNELVETGLAKSFGEINAESWKRQEHETPVELWTEAFRAWQHSKGHWGVASKCWPLFGAAIRKSTQGLWYMTIIVAGEPITPPEPGWYNSPEYKIW